MNGKRFEPGLRLSVAALLLVAAAGCSSNVEKIDSSKGRSAPAARTAEKGSAGEMPAASPPHGAPASAAGPTVTMQGLQWDIAEGLQSEPPPNVMRIAQYRIPSRQEGVKDGELAVFFFGAGSGGGTQANLERWAGQFKQDDGGDPMGKAKIENLTSTGGLKVTTILLAGRYESSGMGGGPSYDEPGWKLFGAVIEGQGGPWFFKAVGPESVIDQYRSGLLEMCKGLRVAP